jgi:AraC-like DNA-binding protein
MSQSVCTLPFEYVDTPERRVLDLEHEGIPCVPALGHSHYTSCRPSVSEHIHPGCLEMTLCMRGSLVFECGGQAHRLLPGNVFVTQPDEWHRLSTNPKGLIMFWLFFRLDSETCPILNLPPAEATAFRQALRSLPCRLFKGTDRLRLAFQRLFKLYDALPAGAFRSLAMRGAVLDLMLALVEAAQTPSEAIPGGSRIASLIEQMRRCPEQEHSIEEMARTTALSPSQLITRFKQVTGLPPCTFLLSCRIRTARKWLVETAKPITLIAQELGFSSSQHFAMQFKREFGITPSALRKGQQPMIRGGGQASDPLG